MKKRNAVFLLAIGCAAVSAQAATVVYTDSQHPPTGLGTGHQLVYLDAPEVVQREVFGALSADPRQAERQANAVLQSPDWQQKEQQIVQAYQGVIQAYGQVHVYNPMTASRSDGYWPPESVTENTGTKNHKWQRLVPSISSSCAVFPDNSNPIATDGAYAWALWQPYSCCQRRGQTFLYSTDF